MEKQVHKISIPSTSLVAKYCAVCGVLVTAFSCKCGSGPKIMQLSIPAEWEEFFWMDGSVKPNLISYENGKC